VVRVSWRSFGDDRCCLTRAAARVSPRLLRRLKKLSKQPLPIAEINRTIGEWAEEHGELRPSYVRVRQLVREFRVEAELPSTAAVALDVAFRARPPSDLLVDQLVLGGAKPLRSR
jgi:hypothetical protein